MSHAAEITLFQQIALVLALATVLGAIATLLRQPLIVAFIAVGVLVGPAGLGMVASGEPFDSLAELGIALLLFLVGLRLDVNEVRRMGAAAAITGATQVVVTAALGFALALACGLPTVPAAYVAVGLAFSSTVIVVKLLADKREIDSLHGRLAVGILIVQDLVVIVTLIALSALRTRTGMDSPQPGIGDVMLRGASLLVGVYLAGRYLLPGVLHRVARSTEALVLFGMAWAAFVGAIAARLGFSIEVGAFLAGISIASTRYRDAIVGRLTSVRDFLLLFFFVTLGATLKVHSLGAQTLAAIVLSLFALVGKPILVMATLGLQGYRKRTSFLTALPLGQISEFSLILVALGLELGHLGEETLGLVTLIGIMTILPSTVLIVRSQAVYEWIAGSLTIFERRSLLHGDAVASDALYDVIILGLGRYGSNIAQLLQERGRRVLGVDFDPDAVLTARRRGVDARYLDAEDPEQLRSLPLEHAAWLICAVPQTDLNRSVLAALRHAEFHGRIAVTAHSASDAEILRGSGADMVFLPFVDAAHEAADRVVEQCATV